MDVIIFGYGDVCVVLGACGSSGQANSSTDHSETSSTEAVAAESDTQAEEITGENTDTLPSSVSNITGAADVPLITLNNGVQVPQLGLGTQIQRLEQDTSAEGRQLLNQTSHDAVVAALQAGYRHLDTAHGYFNEELYCRCQISARCQ